MKIIAESGYIPVGWAIDTYSAVLKYHNLKKEPARPIAEEITSYIIISTRKGMIILLHFNPYNTIDLERTLQGIKDKGLEIRDISEFI